MKRIFKSEKPSFSPEDLKKSLDFDAMVKQTKTIKRIKFRKNLGIGGILVFSIVMLYLALFRNDKKTALKTETLLLKDEMRSTPINVYIWDSVKISTNDTTRIECGGGTYMLIPPGAFVAGSSDSVLVVYQFYQDWADILLNRIPMRYDSAGVRYNLVSDGMIQLYGFNEDGLVEINENIPIILTVPVTDASRGYNVYKLDTSTESWTYIGIPEVIEPTFEYGFTENLPEVENTDERKADIARLKRIKLEKPRQKNKEDFAFRIEFDRKDYPELAAYDELEFVSSDPGFNTDQFSKSWTDIQLTRKRGSKSYFVTLSNGIDRIQFEAQPVFSGNDYKKALKEFETKNKKLQKEIEEKLDELELLEAQNEVAIRARNKEVSRNSLKQLTAQNKVRRFRITSNGYWNLDYPIPIGFSFAKRIARPQYVSGEVVIQPLKGFLIMEGLRTYIEINPNNSFNINKNGSTRLLVMTSTDELYAVNKLELIPEDDGTYIFDMKKIEMEGKSVHEIKQSLGVQ